MMIILRITAMMSLLNSGNLVGVRTTVKHSETVQPCSVVGVTLESLELSAGYFSFDRLGDTRHHGRC